MTRPTGDTILPDWTRAWRQSPMLFALPDWIDPQPWGFRIGTLEVTLARSAEDFRAVQHLRALSFRNTTGAGVVDTFDAHCQHLLIRSAHSPQALGAARLRRLQGPDDLASSYSAQFYDLEVLERSQRACLEIGRICIDTAHRDDPDLLRGLLAGLTRLAQAARAEILMGCASFRGADPDCHAPALAYLATHHLGPAALRPGRRATDVVDLLRAGDPCPVTGLRQVPALLRLYLGLGGWVSDHAVIDRALDTLHVFTVVETAAIPAVRLHSLHLLARG